MRSIRKHRRARVLVAEPEAEAGPVMERATELVVEAVSERAAPVAPLRRRPV